jgi:hypothetical protein
MPKLEDVLKSQGYSDEDIKALGPLLTDTKFRGAVEKVAGTAEESQAKADKLEKDLGVWAEWHQKTAQPAIESAMTNEQNARAEAASLREKFKTLQDQGLITLAQQAGEPTVPQPQNPGPSLGDFDPKKHKLVTEDDVLRFADMEGDAIAAAQDIASQHYELFGTRLPSFRELRKESVAAKKSIDQYWQEKFKVSERRAEIDAKNRADAEAKVRADERSKVISELANPMTRPPSSSRAPFARRGPGSETAQQPWQNSNERSAARVEKALKTALNPAVQ